MSTRSFETEIIQALAKALKRDASTIHAKDHLREDLGLDSLAVIELLFKLEEAFDLEIPDRDLASLTTVAAVSAYIEERAPKAARAVKSRAVTKKNPAKARRTKA